MSQIYEAITNVMRDIGAIGKEKKNQQQGFLYRGIDDVMNALQPLFVANKLFVVPEVLDQKREERTTKNGSNLIYSILTVKYTFYAADGSNVAVTVMGEGMDSADKASNKAMSVAFKYACFQLFCIPTKEMQDPDASTPPASTQKPSVVQKPAAPKQEEQPKSNAVVTEKSVRMMQIERLIKDTPLTMDKVNEWILKHWGKAVPIDELGESNYNELYLAIETATKTCKGVDNGSN